MDDYEFDAKRYRIWSLLDRQMAVWDQSVHDQLRVVTDLAGSFNESQWITSNRMWFNGTSVSISLSTTNHVQTQQKMPGTKTEHPPLWTPSTCECTYNSISKEPLTVPTCWVHTIPPFPRITPAFAISTMVQQSKVSSEKNTLMFQTSLVAPRYTGGNSNGKRERRYYGARRDGWHPPAV